MFGIELVFGSLPVNVLIGLATIVLLYWYSVRNHDYWAKKNVPHVKPLPFLGSLLDNMRKPFQDVEYERYMKLGRVYGHYEGNNPLLSVGDPVLLRDILVKDFAYFINRRQVEFGDKVVDNMLTAIRGEDWKRIRSIVTPTFTTGKIKKMLPIFKDCTEALINNFKTSAKEGKEVDVKRMYSAFSMDVIANSAFSTKIDSLNDPNNQFVQVAKTVFGEEATFFKKIIFLLFFLCPGVLKFFKIPVFASEASKFFKDITLRIIEERKKTGQVRNDFLQLLMDTAKEVSEDQKLETSEKDKEDITSNYEESNAGHQIFKAVTTKKLSIDELVAQSVIFFIAGHDTTASTLAFATYFLALHQDIQDRLRAEVDSAIEDNDGQLTYESIQSMKYLDNIISETLRIYPVAIRLERHAESDYKLRDTGITIPKGMIVSIPVFAIHRDPKLWPDPELYNPDRFMPEEKAKRDPYSYIPFGAGPRNCVGMRFALTQIKVCLAHIIATFKISRCPQTKVPLEFNMGQQGLLQPKEIVVQFDIRIDSHLLK
ncbi:cytochrome P450 3A8-like isoform X1 [Argiope bruennichi]|uniref:cytochrome P450 3A8-like isoform X1 n=2 Tax=Argiope bruennichi TaxID=94029 RepID=UPI002494F0DB|nr:cytochrome P450 3A8-like isoform X1 [Argiope bruennichi]